MKICLNITNHDLTPAQCLELTQRFQIEEVRKLKDKDGNDLKIEVNPDCRHILDGEGNQNLISHAQEFIAANRDENGKGNIIVIIQTEAGLQDYLLQFCRLKGVKAYHATTKRIVFEETQDDGTIKKVSKFEHVCFREYALHHILK